MNKITFSIIVCILLSACLPVTLMGVIVNASQTHKIYELGKKVEQLKDDAAK